MSILNEAQNIIDDGFDAEKKEVYQEFRVVVKVTPRDRNPETVRQLLDRFAKNVEVLDSVGAAGKIDVVQVEPN